MAACVPSGGGSVGEGLSQCPPPPLPPGALALSGDVFARTDQRPAVQGKSFSLWKEPLALFAEATGWPCGQRPPTTMAELAVTEASAQVCGGVRSEGRGTSRSRVVTRGGFLGSYPEFALSLTIGDLEEIFSPVGASVFLSMKWGAGNTPSRGICCEKQMT